MDMDGNGKEHLPVGFGFRQDDVVNLILPNGLFQVTNRRWTQEAMDFDGDLLPCLLRG